MRNQSRRKFIRNSAQAMAAAWLGRAGFLNAACTTPSSGYKALVCIFQYGGNDGNNMIIPIDAAQANYYKTYRSQIAVPTTAKLTAAPTYAFNSVMSKTAALFNNRNLAVLANVGNILKPLNQCAFQSAYLANDTTSVPPSLFSHGDQQAQWQAHDANNLQEGLGWGGLTNDAAAGQSISLAQGSLFGSGQVLAEQVVNPLASCDSSGNVTYSGLNDSPLIFGQQQFAVGATGNSGPLQTLIQWPSGLSLVQAANSISENALSQHYTLTQLLTNNPLITAPAFENVATYGSLALSLLMVAAIIHASRAAGITNQIFFVPQIGSYDTHGGQITQQNNMLADLDTGLSAFQQFLVCAGLFNNVTTFTCSEFGRSFAANNNGGTDHAWGNHHLIMGGGVLGGQIFGEFPDLTIGGSNDAFAPLTGCSGDNPARMPPPNGVLLPTTSIAQYGATLAQWYGVNPASFPNIFPYLGAQKLLPMFPS